MQYTKYLHYRSIMINRCLTVYNINNYKKSVANTPCIGVELVNLGSSSSACKKFTFGKYPR